MRRCARTEERGTNKLDCHIRLDLRQKYFGSGLHFAFDQYGHSVHVETVGMVVRDE